MDVCIKFQITSIKSQIPAPTAGGIYKFQLQKFKTFQIMRIKTFD